MPLAAALVADAGDNQPVTGDAKVVLAGYGVTDFLQFVARKFDQLVAHLTIQMVVLRIAVVVLVNGPATEGHLPKQARLHEFVEGAIDGRPADSVGLVPAAEAVDQFVGIEMVVPGEDKVHECPPLLGDTLSAALQILLESLLWREGNLHFTQ